VKVSVVCATFNRAPLLDRALYTYSKQTLPFDEWEYLLVDDLSDDLTLDVVKKWQDKGLPITVFNSVTDLNRPKKPGEWRDGCPLRNSVSTFATGEVLVSTHPEIMIPKNALELAYICTMGQANKTWCTAVPYWLPKGKMPAWKKNLWNLRTMKGFYSPDWPDEDAAPGTIDYSNQNQERRQTWGSEVWWAMRMSTWRWLGGFREFKQWGSVDMDFMNRRIAAGVKTYIIPDPQAVAESKNLMVFHQNHGSRRDMVLAMKGVEGLHYANKLEARKAGGLYGNYQHGPRERSFKGVDGILGDHVARYEFANYYSVGKDVLDVPCGTGYGRHVLTSAKTYRGIDHDSESIDWATKHYPLGEGDAFRVGDLRDLPLRERSVDRVYCFEGLEHVKEHAKVVDEIFRVLRTGGTFIISTPQKVATPGTPWDRYMLTWDELMGLFDDKRWKNLTPYYQKSYNDPSMPTQGVPPKDAPIMILGGTVVK
jgi:2-polyprenyl-3-methyl-5-hydroxy-6-metoxy-1,4-benzoquinol methylase